MPCGNENGPPEPRPGGGGGELPPVFPMPPVPIVPAVPVMLLPDGLAQPAASRIATETEEMESERCLVITKKYHEIRVERQGAGVTAAVA